MPASTLEQFFTQRPLDQVPYTSLEFYHPDMGLERYVTGQQFAKNFTLETDAPRNANTSVQFEAVPFQAPEPEQGEDADSTLNIGVGAVGQMIKERLKLITDAGDRVPFEVVWRRHLSGVTYPVRIIRYQVDSSRLVGLRAQFEARQVNPASRRIGIRRTSDRIPGLRGFI